MELTQELAAEYERLWTNVIVTPRHEQFAQVFRIAGEAKKARGRYEKVAIPFDMPWEVVAAIHSLEGSSDWTTHLHNGDSLKRRTVNEPSGRPERGHPPFTWEESALDALSMKHPEKFAPWTIATTLFFLERYNGFGYRQHHPDVKSPYLWSFTSAYTAGKYIADGTFSRTAVSAQAGAVPILKALNYEGESA